MIAIRKSADRGRSRAAWLDSRHTFSFADYFDPSHVEFGALRVLNEDWIAPARGFEPHPHRDMEILTWVLEGQLEHRDSGGHASIIRPGRAQLMHAGRGIVHSERNASDDEPLHLLQIWLQPAQRGTEAGYEELDVDLAQGGLIPVATQGGRGGGLDLRQDASVLAAELTTGDEVVHTLRPGRRAFVQVTHGRGRVAGLDVEAGDGVASTDEPALRIRADADLGALVFDLA